MVAEARHGTEQRKCSDRSALWTPAAKDLDGPAKLEAMIGLMKTIHSCSSAKKQHRRTDERMRTLTNPACYSGEIWLDEKHRQEACYEFDLPYYMIELRSATATV